MVDIMAHDLVHGHEPFGVISNNDFELCKFGLHAMMCVHAPFDVTPNIHAFAQVLVTLFCVNEGAVDGVDRGQIAHGC